ncbi:MAG: hypothetical protein RLZZ568_2346, partial [Cyanobacteriota bacterium]
MSALNLNFILDAAFVLLRDFSTLAGSDLR